MPDKYTLIRNIKLSSQVYYTTFKKFCQDLKEMFLHSKKHGDCRVLRGFGLFAYRQSMALP